MFGLEMHDVGQWLANYIIFIPNEYCGPEISGYVRQVILIRSNILSLLSRTINPLTLNTNALKVCPLSGSGFCIVFIFQKFLELFARFQGIKDGNWCGVASFQVLVALSTGMTTRVDEKG
jgi:hypothetical protein